MSNFKEVDREGQCLHIIPTVRSYLAGKLSFGVIEAGCYVNYQFTGRVIDWCPELCVLDVQISTVAE